MKGLEEYISGHFNESLMNKFKVGDIVQDSSGYLRLLILEIDKEHNCYICADTDLGRNIKIKIIDKNIPGSGYPYEKDFNIFKHSDNWKPLIADEIVDEYNLPEKWKVSKLRDN